MTIKNKYTKWISEHNFKRGTCAKATIEMAAAFPELKRVRGFVHDALNKKPLEHWWLKDGDEIVDPTERQFACIIEYEEWNEGADEPTGKCLNCGNYCYHNHSTCSKMCEEEFVNSLK